MCNKTRGNKEKENKHNVNKYKEAEKKIKKQKVGTIRKINADHLYIDDYMRYAAGKPQAELKPKTIKIVIPFAIIII